MRFLSRLLARLACGGFHCYHDAGILTETDDGCRDPNPRVYHRYIDRCCRCEKRRIT